jgi:putative mRNA 3-end processing factor
VSFLFYPIGRRSDFNGVITNLARRRWRSNNPEKAQQLRLYAISPNGTLTLRGIARIVDLRGTLESARVASVNANDLIRLSPNGLYCPAGDFHIDPWAPVDRCVITHAHSDHAQPGSKSYLTSAEGETILRTRLGPIDSLQTLRYGEKVKLNDVTVSLHPAGHVLGSAQVRIERNGEIWVVSSDYKTVPDSTCTGFELLQCHTFITESTFGLPIFRWRPTDETFAEINNWWRANAADGKCSVIFGYALGKAQRILSGLDTSIGPIYTHGAIENMTRVYRDSGIQLPVTQHTGTLPHGTKFSGSLVMAPPSATNTPWLRQFHPYRTGFASGWMRIRGTRRRKSLDKGFVLSDHADWDELNTVIRGTGAQRILVTHGYATEMVKWLRQSNLDAEALPTKFEGELGEMQPPEGTSEAESDEAVTI